MWKLSKIFYRVSLNSEVKVNLLKQLLTSSLQQYTCQLLCLRAWASGLQIKEYSILHQLLHADLLERKKLSYNNLDWHIYKKYTNSTKFKAVQERIHVNDPSFPEISNFRTEITGTQNSLERFWKSYVIKSCTKNSGALRRSY